MGTADSLEKTLMLGKIEGRRMQWLDSITDSTDMNLGEPWVMVRDREAWSAAVHRVTKSQTQLSNWKSTTKQGPSSVCTNTSFSQERLPSKFSDELTEHIMVRCPLPSLTPEETFHSCVVWEVSLTSRMRNMWSLYFLSEHDSASPCSCHYLNFGVSVHKEKVQAQGSFISCLTSL